MEGAPTSRSVNTAALTSTQTVKGIEFASWISHDAEEIRFRRLFADRRKIHGVIHLHQVFLPDVQQWGF